MKLQETGKNAMKNFGKFLFIYFTKNHSSLPNIKSTKNFTKNTKNFIENTEL